MEPKTKSQMSPEQYLEIERKAEYKSEYFNGEMFALAGAKENHNLIVLNTGSELRSQLKGRPCKVYPGDMRVRAYETGLYTYPEVVIVCVDPSFEDKERDTLLNPVVIIEVLSESTEAYDRGRKFEHYRQIPSLQEYVLISQDRYKIEKFTRHKEWTLSEEGELEKSIDLPSIRCSLKLAEVYDKVTF